MQLLANGISTRHSGKHEGFAEASGFFRSSYIVTKIGFKFGSRQPKAVIEFNESSKDLA